MKRTSFLRRLFNEGKLEIVEESQIISNSYLEKSKSYIESAKILFNNSKIEESVSLSYYSMYYSLLAFLFRVGIKCENHTASIMLLRRLFGIENSIILNAKIERVDKQYYVDFEVNRKEVQDLFLSTEKFNSQLKNTISRLNRDKIEKYKNKFKQIIIDSE